MELKDVQSLYDPREISIDKVGIKGIRYPVSVLDKRRGVQHTVAEINMYVDLPREFKGTHMSRFIEILNEFREEIYIKNIPFILDRMREKLSAKVAHLEISFPYFLKKEAPVTQAPSLMEYQCFISGAKSEEELDIVLGVRVPVMTVCPCSQAISEIGAHNQRGEVTLKVRFKRFVWLEELIEIVEASASSPVYPLLKRPDEKYVTEWAHQRPRFVEDVVREVGRRLLDHPDIIWFAVSAENLESIHAHNAYAYLERWKD
ncbi:GTP cyclohydrolase FolE2 [Thermosulfurimonas dismutans]|uniref:GTP cyclohydrolase FolE2 n=1 Tax=Thermosulfurimonas dismutans TaxID=999894 RepID=A0A179D4P3_9BACT|nr:GTP cyclohydrolase FolE2 [Thermosulfurimonas dismutans]OAQ21037.1 GTP cyclohydrolase I type 2 [Thermosulfurimonas dismutans]